MTPYRLILRSLIHYRRTHLGTLIGTVTAAGILIGALIVGDSVKYSLNRLVSLRLGETEFAITAGDRYFRADLAKDIGSVLDIDPAPVLQSNGLASSDNQLRISGVQVLGVDERFWALANTDDLTGEIKDTEALLNIRMASALGLNIGDEFVLRVQPPQEIPGDASFARREEHTESVRLTLVGIVENNQLGRFGIQANQVSPYNVFLNLDHMGQWLEMRGEANLILIPEKSDITKNRIYDTLLNQWTLEDADLTVSQLDGQTVSLTSGRVFLDDPVKDAVSSAFPNGRTLFTYFVNQIKHGTRSTPYSFVASAQLGLFNTLKRDEIIITRWLAQDLSVKIGDSLAVDYYYPETDLTLSERSTDFIIKSIISLDSPNLFPELSPQVPGLSDSENCRDWDPGMPIDLDLIRDKDEVYWENYKETPKAIISLDKARELWANRYGDATAVLITNNGMSSEPIGEQILKNLTPSALGFQTQPVRAQGQRASAQGVDFGQLFIGLSFFIVTASLMLTGLLYVLGMEQRSAETATLRTIGFSPKRIRSFLLWEGIGLATVACILGAVVGIAYNRVVLAGLSTIWQGAVGSTLLIPHIQWSTVGIGIVSSIILAILAMALTLRKQGRQSIRQLLALQRTSDFTCPKRKSKWMLIIAIICFIIVISTLVTIHPGRNQQAAAVFGIAGTLLLIGCLLTTNWILTRFQTHRPESSMSLGQVAISNMTRKKGRTLTTMALLATGIFIIIAVGANKQSGQKDSAKKESGTGGFTFYAETTVSINRDLNDPSSLRRLNLADHDSGKVAFIQCRMRPGDDASCLNLNRIQQPRILGIDPNKVESRFSFTGFIEDDAVSQSWKSLDADYGPGLIPALADQTVITWGLGKAIGDTLIFTDDQGQRLQLLLVGGIANSIFQGSILISENHFVQYFPSISGTRVFLIDAPFEQSDKIQTSIRNGLRDAGIDITTMADRLSSFMAVQNTYLAIFMALGGLGLIIGTVGMGVVVARNIMERRKELALLQAVGFRKVIIGRILIFEQVLLLLAGLLIGALSALISVLPAISAPGVEIPYVEMIVILGLIFISGFAWTRLTTRLATRSDLIPALREE